MLKDKCGRSTMGMKGWMRRRMRLKAKVAKLQMRQGLPALNPVRSARIPRQNVTNIAIASALRSHFSLLS